MKLIFLLFMVVIFKSNINDAVVTLFFPSGTQTTIQEDTTVQTNLTRFDVDNGGATNDIICFVQHVIPQPNTDPLIGPFETVARNEFSFFVVYDPNNGFRLNTLIQVVYQLRVCCYESSQSVTPDPPSCSPLFVTVTKNLPPSITGPTQVDIDGDDDPGEVLGTYFLRDDVDQSTLSLSLSSVPKDAASFFNIEYNINGTTTLTNAVNAQNIPYGQISLFINATDGKDNSVLAVQVTVNDVNTRPDILELPLNITLREDTAKETTITRLTPTDDEGQARFDKCLVNPREESDIFFYDTFRRELKLSNVSAQPLDFETHSFYNITCIATDGFLESRGENILIFVQDVNEAPVFQRTSQTCQLYESPAGEAFCDVSFLAIDPDNDAVTLSLAGNFSDRFALTDNNKRLTFAVDYDLEAISSPNFVTLTVVGSDNRGATGTTLINVAIADVNDNDPVFTTEITTIPVEFATARGLIGTLTATDRDLGTNGDLEFSTVSISPPDAATHFSLFNNGELHYLSQFPDTLAGSTALIVAEAKDKGTPSRSATSTIAIAFGTTTTTTTTTASTTTQTTQTTTTTTTTAAPTAAPFDFWSRPENVAMFTILMLLLLLLLLALLWLCLRFCCAGLFGGGGSTMTIFRNCCGACFGRCCDPEGSVGGFWESCRNCDCDCDCCRPPRKIQPQIVRSIDYNEDFWNKRDHYESGKPLK